MTIKTAIKTAIKSTTKILLNRKGEFTVTNERNN